MKSRGFFPSLTVALSALAVLSVAFLPGSTARAASNTADSASVPTWAQSYGFGSYDANGQPFDDNTYGSGADLPAAIAPMPDGGVVVAGRLAPNELNPGSGAGATGLVRYDADGAIVWQQLLRQNNDSTDGNGGVRAAQNRLSQMKTDAAGNIFVCGGLGRDDGNIVAPFVAKFSPAGALLWQNSLNTIIEQDIISGAPHAQAYGVTEYTTMDLTSDGGLMVGSYVYSGGNAHYDPIIVKFNSDGAVAFHRIYASGNQYSGVLSICARQGGNGFALLLSADNGGFGFVAMLTDANGNPVLQRRFNADRSGGDAAFITQSSDGGYFLLGGRFTGAEVRKVHGDLSPIWQKNVYGYNPFHGQGFVGTLTALPDGGCMLGGQIAEASYRSGGNGAASAALLTLDASGVLRSAHLLGGPGGESFSGSLSVSGAAVNSCVTTDGGLALTTSTFSYATGSKYKADWWVVKAGMDGKVAGFSGTMSDPPLTFFALEESAETASVVTNDYGPGLANELDSTTTSEPRIIQEDLGNNIGINKPTVKTQTVTPIPAPVHGGLSGITFTVNESADPLPGLADTVLRFRAVQSGRPAGLKVKVQASTNNGATWVNLPDATGGQMAYASRLSAFILNSTNYPTVGGVYFRAFAEGSGYPSPASSPVGPFDLSSSKAHLGGPLLFVSTNGEVNAIRFGVKQTDIPSGITVQIQTSETPADEASWTSAPIGSNGQMTQDTSTPDLHQFYLGTDDYPEREGIYFRAVAMAGSSYVPSYSFVYGPFKFVTDPPAVVKIKLNGESTARNDIDGGYLLPSGTFNMRADATSGRFIKRLTLLYDGITIGHFDNGATTGALDYTSNIPGDHLIEAYATDDLGVTGAAVPIHVRILPPSPGKAFRMQSSGNWNQASNWIDTQGNPGVPGPNDFAIVSTFSPTLTTDVTVKAMSLNGGTLSGAHTLTVTGFCTIADGAIKSNLTIPSGSTCELLNDTDITLTGTFNYSGTVRLHGKGGIGGINTVAARSALIGSDPDGLFDFIGGIIRGAGQFFVDLAAGGKRGSKATPASAPSVVAPEKRAIKAAQIQIPAGKVTVVPPPAIAALLSQDGGGVISRDGAGVISRDGAGLVASGGGNLVASGGGNLVPPANLLSQDGGGLVASGGGNLVASGGGNLLSQDGGGFVASGGGNLVASGGGNNPTGRNQNSNDAAADSAGLVLSDGELDLSELNIYGDVTMEGGVLSGSGIILGNLTNNSGFVSPGHSAGAIAVTGSFSQAAGGSLIVENGGATPDKFDQLLVDGAASLGGKLVVHTINDYTPDPADTFSPLGYGSATGSFASISSNTGVTLTANGALATTNPNIASPIDAALRNISTRARIGTGGDVLIGGFIVTGPSGSTKKVMVRGLGPSLAAAGLTGLLSDPLLELHKPDGSTVTNDNWADLPNKNEIPNGFAPQAKESVVIADLPPGNYTVIERGAHGETGVGLAEIYDLNESSLAHLGNIATRAFVDITDNVLIGGFIVGGTEPGSILVRAVGPSLTGAGIPNALADPILELHDANGSVFLNDDWRETQESEIIATTIPPNDSREPAILATLVPGNYTVIVRGKNNTTGVGLVEAYNVK